MDVEALVRPVVESAGMELIEVSFGREAGRRVLRVTIDRAGGVDLEAISETSERISRRLDLEGFEPGPYALEVSSPGIERPLKEPRHFQRHLGDPVRVRTNEPANGSKRHTGVLVSADAEAIEMATDGGALRVPYTNIVSARTVVDWDAEMRKRGTT